MKVKGFTLIELLAVIVILAIIALIAVPIVLNIINNSKDSTRIRSAELYLDAVSNAIARKNLSSAFNPQSCEIQSNGNLKCDGQDEEIIIEVDGERPKCGNINIIEGKITSYTLNISGYEISKGMDGKITTKETNKCSFKAYTDEVLGSAPDIDYQNEITGEAQMVPLIYDGENWKIADISEKWYDYNNQEWANAGMLKANSGKQVGDSVTVEGTNSDILAMYVWIPRYEYKIDGTYGKGGTSASLPGEIEVNFISKDTTEATEGYRIHPAFTFGEEISGMWIGKFETSHVTFSESADTMTSLSCSTTDCQNADGLRILPNVRAIQNNNISNLFYGIKSMSRNGNPFGIDSSTMDSHMIKNSEWGAVAYLSQSRYGKYGNDDYAGANKEVYINNSGGSYTGRSGGSYGGNTAISSVYTDKTSTEEYNSTGFYTYDGYLLEYNTNTKATSTTRDLTKVASTTGNITGIYDMSGGVAEFVMGVFSNSSGYKWSGRSSTTNSGFTGKVGDSGTDYEGIAFPDEKYYDVFKASSGTTIKSTTACNSGICYGHGLSETAGWYNDSSKYFVDSSSPWFMRGGNYNNASTGNSGQGIFSYESQSGGTLLMFNEELGQIVGFTARAVLTEATN